VCVHGVEIFIRHNPICGQTYGPTSQRNHAASRGFYHGAREVIVRSVDFNLIRYIIDCKNLIYDRTSNRQLNFFKILPHKLRRLRKPLLDNVRLIRKPNPDIPLPLLAKASPRREHDARLLQ
jgi:hypothetical protein